MKYLPAYLVKIAGKEGIGNCFLVSRKSYKLSRNSYASFLSMLSIIQANAYDDRYLRQRTENL